MPCHTFSFQDLIICGKCTLNFISFFYQLATEALAQAALVMVQLIWFLLMLCPVEAILIKTNSLQDRPSQDNVSIVIADLGYAHILSLQDPCTQLSIRAHVST